MFYVTYYQMGPKAHVEMLNVNGVRYIQVLDYHLLKYWRTRKQELDDRQLQSPARDRILLAVVPV